MFKAIVNKVKEIVFSIKHRFTSSAFEDTSVQVNKRTYAESFFVTILVVGSMLLINTVVIFIMFYETFFGIYGLVTAAVAVALVYFIFKTSTKTLCKLMAYASFCVALVNLSVYLS